MDEEQQFCLRWNNFQSNITSQFEVLRDEEDFVDVTLACDGQHVKAHKVVLSACSPYFKELFRSNPCKHPILFMRDVEFQHLQSLVEFMYTGEVNVAQAHLTAFLHTAESLQIRGLTEGPQRHKQQQLPPDSSLPSAAKVQRQLQGLSTSVTQKQLTPHHHTNNNKAPSVTSRRNSLSSPEGNNGNDDEVFSLSPPSSPLPAKRQCRGELLESNNLQSSSVSHLLNSQDLIASKPDLESYKDDSLEILEPKLEVPDYNSDSESKTDSAAMASTFLGLDTNSVDINTTMASLHSGMEMPGTSAQNFLGETSQDSAQVDLRKLHSLDPRPCPICNRMYSNLSNLRQHVRLIHNPQTVACPLCSKPFKTKLYLKRHLMSFHELLCTSPGAPQPTRAPTGQGGEFFPPPQVFLGQQNEEKGAYQGSQAKRELPGQVSEFYQNLRLFGNANSDERGTFHNNQSISGNSEVVSFSPSLHPQGCKEERGTYQVRGPDKLSYRPHQSLENKPPEIPVPASFLNTLSHSNDTRPSLLSQPLHVNDEEMPTFLNQQMTTNTQESTAFLSLSHEKTDKGSSYLDSVLHAGGREGCTDKQTEGK